MSTVGRRRFRFDVCGNTRSIVGVGSVNEDDDVMDVVVANRRCGVSCVRWWWHEDKSDNDDGNDARDDGDNDDDDDDGAAAAAAALRRSGDDDDAEDDVRSDDTELRNSSWRIMAEVAATALNKYARDSQGRRRRATGDG